MGTDWVTDFVRDGYAVLPGVVPADRCQAAQQLVGTHLNDADLDDHRLEAWTQVTFVPEIETARELLSLYTGAVSDAVALLLQPYRALPVLRAQIQVRVPGERSDAQPVKEPHVDGLWCPHLPAGTVKSFTLLAGIALTDSRAESGTLNVSPGGHRRVAAWIAQHGILTPPESGEVPAQAAERMVPLELSAGDAVLLHYLTPHAVGRNATDQKRVIVYFRVTSDAHARLGNTVLVDADVSTPGAMPTRAL